MIIPSRIEVANLGMWDSLILMVMALVVFGPRRLPEIARRIGKIMYEVRKASNDFKFQMEEELRVAEEADRRKKAEAVQPIVTQPPALAASSPVSEAGVGTPGVVDTPPVSEENNPYPDGANYAPVSTSADSAAAVVPASEPASPESESKKNTSESTQ
jgi:sec-independent protein translocase protein TatB